MTSQPPNEPTQEPQPQQPGGWYFPPGPGSEPPQGYGPPPGSQQQPGWGPPQPPGYGPPGYGPPGQQPPQGGFIPTGPRPPRKKNKGLRIGCLSVLGVLVLIIIVSVIASAASGNKNNAGNSAGSSNSPGSSLPSQPPAAVVQSSAPAAPVSSAPQYTASQQQAIQSAQGYLSDGQGFSKAGLIGQLDSSAGDGFSYADALFAVNHVSVSWDQQAAMSAKGYMNDGQGFSCSSLLQQLESSSGESFTHAQAEYGVHSVGLGTC